MGDRQSTVCLDVCGESVEAGQEERKGEGVVRKQNNVRPGTLDRALGLGSTELRRECFLSEVVW